VGPQSRSGRFGENSLTPAGIPTPDRPVQHVEDSRLGTLNVRAGDLLEFIFIGRTS